ncbi:phage shock protein PspC (stress-responsive transcriptional regulator) [Sphingomonas vulcanisoli]|uniref:Phage shock protein PspC (Stress-responsive transcriptional regulator) n=1 Tax=Sphingomonas vulcanisoli TaxID=1658060 RepID=A0ABX0TPP0_9SPHN|nr:PspC domain-containing protein [Sphingomonas vulcanisoli]NIJ07501.1 phage shock protein PspC (stress-responsive transcriptional regulator) [Sphingomonas vulcanisoli]
MDNMTSTPATPRENLFGVCAEIGETIGVNPLWIRLGFLVSIMAVSLKLTLVAYCVAAVAFKLAKR